MPDQVIRVALAVPLYQFFDYVLPADAAVVAGCRVRVPFGRASKIGLVVAVGVEPGCERERLKTATAVLDDAPLLHRRDLEFLGWAANYYHHPAGEVIATALPARLRKNDRALAAEESGWQVSATGRAWLQDPSRPAPRQAELLAWLAAQPDGRAALPQMRSALPNTHRILRALHERGFVVPCAVEPGKHPITVSLSDMPDLSPEQAQAVATVEAASPGFAVYLLDGVTGSGKTEVYLRLTAGALAAGRSVLVLVPEIALTPQLFARFRARLGETVRVLHSGLTDSEREQTWHRVRQGLSKVLLGTRSAIYTPMPDLGLVVVDEEHDPSLKQAEGFRYSARDLAVIRGQRAACAVVLGSATPSFESLRNAWSGHYHHLCLDRRVGGARPPRVDLLDLRDQPLQSGLSAPLLQRLGAVLDAGNQAMVFLNRRGFAPVLTCFSCGWVSDCPHCDAHQTLHRHSGRLWCHHCGAQRRAPSSCPDCGSTEVHPLGQGTEQLEDFLAAQFPGTPLIRIDRDATARRGALEGLLERLEAPGPALLVGTQMLAKGHHFPRVTLVGVVDADGGLYSADFRATERLAQLLVQVAGRAGRGERPGQVLIQTRFPDHPLLRTLVREGYRAFAQAGLGEREAAMLPPYSHQALVRADARDMDVALAFLERAAELVRQGLPVEHSTVATWGPVPAPMARRGGRQRAQLLLQAARRAPLHQVLDRLAPRLSELQGARRVRWSLDVDPMDLY